MKFFYTMNGMKNPQHFYVNILSIIRLNYVHNVHISLNFEKRTLKWGKFKQRIIFEIFANIIGF